MDNDAPSQIGDDVSCHANEVWSLFSFQSLILALLAINVGEKLPPRSSPSISSEIEIISAEFKLFRNDEQQNRRFKILNHTKYLPKGRNCGLRY